MYHHFRFLWNLFFNTLKRRGKEDKHLKAQIFKNELKFISGKSTQLQACVF